MPTTLLNRIAISFALGFDKVARGGTPRFQVSLDVASPEAALKEQLSTGLTRDMQSLDDVSVVGDRDAQFKLQVVGPHPLC
jgi:hypothetical protein